MKLWIKYFIAVALGILLGFFLPSYEVLDEILTFLGGFSINVGRYVLFPLVFFSLPIAVCQLKRLKKFNNVILRIVLSMLIATALMLAVGMTVALLLPSDRIPITIQEDLDYQNPPFTETVNQIVNPNLFQVFTGDASLLLPLCALALILGMLFHFDKEQTGPAFNLFDSFSRIFYRLNMYIVKVQAFLIFFIAFVTIRSLKGMSDFSFYTQHILVLTISSAVVLFILYPLTLYLIGGRGNPLNHVYSIMTPLLTGLVSGDIFYNYGILTAHLKENEGISREVGGITAPLFTLFARSGTALVGGASMLLIIRSYTSLELTPFQILWVFFFSFIYSFALSHAPRLGIYALLALLCGSYGRGLDRGYILLLPMLPVLIGFSALLDTVCIVLLSRITAYNVDLLDEVPSKEFL
ncbi:MAG: cation:dicarboxylase symporter family transporter [Spirochaetales bacterium]|nr:cation:dicarboxylase symporter family transporter [Spirochaetales bacterium]